MSSSRKSASQARSRRARVFKVAPVTVAVRSALAASVAALALSTTPVAQAGTCTFTTPPNQWECTGDFTGPVGALGFDDITVVVGDGVVPTSVVPPDGSYGVVVVGGNTHVSSVAAITTNGGNGIDVEVTGSATVANGGTITTYNGMAIDVVAGADAGVVNSGTLYAYGVDDVSTVFVESTGVGYTASIENQAGGSIGAYSVGGAAVGAFAYSAQGDVVVTNAGSIDAYSYFGLADGIFASGVTTSVTNSGDISANGNTWAAGIEAYSDDLTTVGNSGNIYAYAYDSYGEAFGIHATSTGGPVSVDNSGYISAVSSTDYGHSAGIHATSGTGGVTIDNSGSISASGAYVYGIEVESSGLVDINSSGSIDAYAQFGFATGIDAVTGSDGADITIDNSGTIYAAGRFGGTGISAVATGYGSSASVTNSSQVVAVQGGNVGYGSTGIVASADADATIDNSGYVVAYGGSAYGAMALAFSGDASVTNSGLIAAISGGYGNAAGIVAASNNGAASVDNSGYVQVDAGSYAGIGMQATGNTGATATNSGEILVEALYAYGIYANAGAGDVVIGNSGLVDVYSGPGIAFGAIGLATQGDIAVDNSGAIYADAFGQSVGVFTSASAGGISVDNAGLVEAYSYAGTAVGVFARANAGAVDIDNAGTIAAISPSYEASGIRAFALDVDVANEGVVQAIGGSSATGIEVVGTNSASVTNNGNVYAVAKYPYGVAQGIYAVAVNGDAAVTTGDYSQTVAGAKYGAGVGILSYSAYGAATVVNGGQTGAIGFLGATGIYASGAAGATVENAGEIMAVSYAGDANGVVALSYGDVVITHAGSTMANSKYGDAVGLTGYSATGNVSVDNSGDILAQAPNGLADGIFASGVTTDVTNSGYIGAMGYGWAAGIEAYGVESATVANSGAIYAMATDDYGQAFGIHATALPDGAVSASNDGSIEVVSSTGYGHSAGILALSGAGGVTIDNSGDIVASGAFVYGIQAQSAGVIDITNAGTIDAYAQYGYATGISAVTNYAGANITIDNSGSILADGMYGGTGIVAVATGEGATASVSNSGTIYASQGDKYVAGAAGIVVSADGDATIDTSGSITTVSGGAAYGAMALSFAGDAHVVNSGDIDVSNTAMKYYGAYGIVSASSNGSASADNGGSITVVSDKYNGFGMQVSGNTGATATNSGSISVDAKYAYGIYASAGAGDVSIVNDASGVIDVYSGPAIAFGAIGIATQGDVVVDNAGAIHADAYGQSVGAFALSVEGNVSVGNSGTIQAYSYADIAVGVFARADLGSVSVDNNGEIVAESPYAAAAGIRAIGTDVTVGNDGLVAAMGGDYATGIDVVGTNSASVTNNGAVYAVAKYPSGIAQGIYAVAVNGDVSVTTGSESYTVAAAMQGGALGIVGYSVLGGATVDNAGAVYAIGYLGATGIYASGATGATVHNAGDVGAESYVGNANGVVALSYGDVVITHAGNTVANTVFGDAVGLTGYSATGNVSVDNSGTIAARSVYGLADGIFASGVTTDVANSGYIGAMGYGWAAGIEAYGEDSATVVNSGAIYAMATDEYGQAFGIHATALPDGSVSASNDGSIEVVSSTGYGHSAGILALSGAGGVTVDNGGSIVASGAYVYGIQAQSAGLVDIANSGSIDVYAQYGFATGISAVTNYAGANITIDNSGSIDASSMFGSTGIVAVATGEGATGSVTNSGTIDAAIVGGGKYEAAGIVVSADGDATIDNSGGITVYSPGAAYGAIALSFAGDAHVVNSGDIDVGNAAMKYYGAYGIVSASNAGAAFADNSGNITVASDKYNGFGMQVSGNTGATATNSGSISVDAKYAYGVLASAGQGDVLVDNSGTIEAYSYLGIGFGVLGLGTLGDVTVGNSGVIDAYGYGQTVGVFARSDAGSVAVDSSGTIAASSYASAAAGVFGRADDGHVAIDNSGSIAATSLYGTAYGILAGGHDVAIVNGGDITVDGYAFASGIDASGDVVSVSSDGNVDSASTTGNAFGVYALASGNVDVATGAGGSISASAPAGVAYGVLAYSTGGNVTVDSAGDITVDGLDAATGVYASGLVAGVTNAGDITSAATGLAVGIEAYGYDAVSAANAGSIASTSSADDAAGMLAISTYGTVTVDNGGSIAASGAYLAAGIVAVGATVDASNAGQVVATGTDATGIQAIGDGEVAFANAGDVSAIAYGDADGVYLVSVSGDISADNGGSISAAAAHGDAFGAIAYAATGHVAFGNAGDITATGTDGASVGLLAAGYAGVEVDNSGAIHAASTGAGSATGLVAMGGTVIVDNSGSITAEDADQAVAVDLTATGVAVLYNSGTLQSHAADEGEIAVLGGDGVQHVVNDGQLYGAIVAGGGNDAVVNGGTWLVTNHATDFGAGDDSLVNATGGIIEFIDGAISFGGGAGNAFTNHGTILVTGSGLIDLGTGGEATAAAAAAVPVANAVPSLNAVPMVNDGVIDFLDGQPDDVLTIVGDLGGDGALNIDVGVLGGTSDMLYVDGSIVDGAAQTVNVAFDGNPTVGATAIPFAHVTGDSAAGSFVGGEVIGYHPNNFLTLRVDVTSELSAGNASPDVFSIGVAPDGVSEAGLLAVSIPAGAHSLVNSQIGTWRQRMGVMPAKGEDMAGLSAWIRAFSDKGDIDQQHANVFGQNADIRFEQDNDGHEAGMNFNVHGAFNFGLTLGKSDGTQQVVGVGTTRMDMSSAGLYATWASPKFYIDGSWRWMDFDAALNSWAGQHRTSGNATAFNVEAGFNAFTLAGIDIVPQAQYTRTRITDIAAMQDQFASFDWEGGVSERARVGVGLSRSFTSGDVLWTPYGSLNAVRELDGENHYLIGDTYGGTTSTEGTSALVEMGVGMQANGFSVTGGLNWTDGGALDSFVGGQVVLRYTW